MVPLTRLRGEERSTYSSGRPEEASTKRWKLGELSTPKPRNRMPPCRPSSRSRLLRFPRAHCTRSAPAKPGSTTSGRARSGARKRERITGPARPAGVGALSCNMAVPPRGDGSTGTDGADRIDPDRRGGRGERRGERDAGDQERDPDQGGRIGRAHAIEQAGDEAGQGEHPGEAQGKPGDRQEQPLLDHQ